MHDFTVHKHYDNKPGLYRFDVDNDAAETEMIVEITGSDDPELPDYTIQIDTNALRTGLIVWLGDAQLYDGHPDRDESLAFQFSHDLRSLIREVEFNHITRGAIEVLLKRYGL